MRSRPASLAPDPQGSGKTCPLLLVHKEAEDPDTTRGEGSILLIGWSTPSPWTLDTAEQPLSSSPTASSCAGPTPHPQGTPVPNPAPHQLAGHCIGEAKKGCREGEGGMIWENDIETSILTYVKRIASPGSMQDTGCSGAGALGWPRGMVWGGRWEGDSGWGTLVHLWQIHVDVWQNQYNIVK